MSIFQSRLIFKQKKKKKIYKYHISTQASKYHITQISYIALQKFSNSKPGH